jgi:hypothetical protein
VASRINETSSNTQALSGLLTVGWKTWLLVGVVGKNERKNERDLVVLFFASNLPFFSVCLLNGQSGELLFGGKSLSVLFAVIIGFAFTD